MTITCFPFFHRFVINVIIVVSVALSPLVPKLLSVQFMWYEESQGEGGEGHR